MKINLHKQPQNKKQAEKLEQEKREQNSAVIRHADYEAQQQKVQAPFGKEFKTGGHKTGKKDGARVNEKRKWQKDY